MYFARGLDFDAGGDGMRKFETLVTIQEVEAALG
jgi:hypothetical protein